MTGTGAVRVGTSGWSYPHWRGRFYPPGLPARRWLRHLAERFDAVEVNTTFYRIPRPAHVDGWARQVPPGFRLALKLWRGVTHARRLRGAAPYLRDFLAAAARLPPDRRGPLLVQLPPHLPRDVARLAPFLDTLTAAAGDEAWRVAVEFRHPSWDHHEVRAALEARRMAFCLHDKPGWEHAGIGGEAEACGFVYVRRHGPGGDVGARYPAEAVAEDAARVRAWRDRGLEVWVFYNNDVHAAAPADANALRAALGPGRATRRGLHGAGRVPGDS